MDEREQADAAGGFGPILRALMAEHGFTSSYQLAKASGLNESYLGRLLKGTAHPGRETLTNLATFFQVSTDHLTGRLTPGQLAAAELQQFARALTAIPGGGATVQQLAALPADDQAAVVALIGKLAALQAPARRRKPAAAPTVRILGDRRRADRPAAPPADGDATHPLPTE